MKLLCKGICYALSLCKVKVLLGFQNLHAGRVFKIRRIAKNTHQLPSYTNTKGLDKEKLRQMVLQYLSNAGDEGAKRDCIYEYLKDVLPANKTEEQKLRYVGRLLVELNEEKQIDRIGLRWILKDYNRSV